MYSSTRVLWKDKLNKKQSRQILKTERNKRKVSSFAYANESVRNDIMA